MSSVLRYFDRILPASRAWSWLSLVVLAEAPWQTANGSGAHARHAQAPLNRQGFHVLPHGSTLWYFILLHLISCDYISYQFTILERTCLWHVVLLLWTSWMRKINDVAWFYKVSLQRSLYESCAFRGCGKSLILLGFTRFPIGVIQMSPYESHERHPWNQWFCLVL